MYYLVTYRLDVIGLCLFTALGVWLSSWFMSKRRQSKTRLPSVVLVAAAALVACAALIAEYAAKSQRDTLASIFGGFGPTYALGLQKAGHARVTFTTPPNDPTYLRLIELEKTWLSLNPLIADIYTFRRDAQGNVRLVVDSETDYNGNGVIDEDREKRTPIGELYKEATPEFLKALDGHAAFDTSMVPDRWGVWVSSLTPIFDDAGHLDGAVGIDYPARQWLLAIALRRGLILTIAVFLIWLLLSSATLITLMRAEITARAAAQKELQQAKDAADAASSAKGRFLAVMSHEIRTPLTAIVGYASMLEGTALDPAQHRYVRTLRRGANSLVDLLNNVLDYSRIEEGRLELEEMPCVPADIVHDVTDLFCAAAREKNLSLQVDDTLPSQLTILSDQARLRQVLVNLVGNAVKFTSQGSVTVRSTWASLSSTPATGMLQIAIIDTGPGIPPEKAAKLFQPFTQADAATARLYGGSGLGLAISRHLVEMMHGKIAVQSTVNCGSEFSFSLPCRRINTSESEERPAVPAASYPAPTDASILVVDDNPVNREILKSLLTHAGYPVDVAQSGPAAISSASQQRYAAILMDLAMPGMDGLTTTAKIRESGPNQATPVVAVTAATSATDRESCRAAGMVDFVSKPVDRATLLAAVRRACGR